MLFNSFPFVLIFLPAVVAGYFASARFSTNLSRLWLIACSFTFCAGSGPGSAIVLACSLSFNYAVSLRLGTENPASSRWLLLALFSNILALGVFKYSAFAVLNAQALTGSHWHAPSFIQPLGISFFTIQQIMFLVDRHQGITPRQRFTDYALFVSWFPYMVAGPITRWKEVTPQFQAGGSGEVGWENLSRGTVLFVLGLLKKVAISDSFAKWVAAGFSQPAGLGWVGSWVVAACFAMQLYFDFSGYTDMARGVALTMNVRLPENFNDPFRALGIIEFWQRWHMTLTHFITNYLYTPILRHSGRPTLRKSMAATVVAMTIAGLWHGASWNYVVFGLWHGIGLALNQAWRRSKRRIAPAPAWFVTAVFILVGFVFFRSATLPVAFSVLHAMFVPGVAGGKAFQEILARSSAIQILGMMAGLAALFSPRTARVVSEEVQLRTRSALAAAALAWLALVVMNSRPPVEFIYRQF